MDDLIMNSILTCSGCNGRKQVAPLGGILKNCAICEGVGFITHVNTVIEPLIDQSDIFSPLILIDNTDIPSIDISEPIKCINKEQTFKQRGRPKRIL